jgi:hypothetical protein
MPKGRLRNLRQRRDEDVPGPKGRGLGGRSRYLKSRHPKDIVEILDCATRAKLIVFEDGRVTAASAL